MTQYSTSFDSYTADVQPSDWTARWTTANTNWLVRSKAGAEGGKTLENTGTVSAFHLLTWDAIDADANRADTEILARVRPSNSTTEMFALTVRGSGAAGSEGGYSVRFDINSFRVQKFIAGVYTDLAPSITIFPTGAVWYYLRFRANGTSLKFKIWKDGEVEPSAWAIDITDSSITAAGWVGLCNRVYTNTRDCDWFSVGTNGDTAPLPSATATSIRVSQVVNEAALATVAPGRVTQVVTEAIHKTVAQARITQMVTEVAISAPIAGQVSQMVVEVAFSNVADVGATQQPRMIVLM